MAAGDEALGVVEASSSGQTAGSPGPEHVANGPGVAPTGQRQAFRDIRRQLTEKDLSNPGVQKLILDELERADADCEELRGYVERYHEADKRAAILQERARAVTAIEIMFAVGVGIGSAIVGLAPLFWTHQPQGWICLAVGGILIVGSSVARVIKR